MVLTLNFKSCLRSQRYFESQHYINAVKAQLARVSAEVRDTEATREQCVTRQCDLLVKAEGAEAQVRTVECMVLYWFYSCSGVHRHQDGVRCSSIFCTLLGIHASLNLWYCARGMYISQQTALLMQRKEATRLANSISTLY